MGVVLAKTSNLDRRKSDGAPTPDRATARPSSSTLVRPTLASQSCTALPRPSIPPPVPPPVSPTRTAPCTAATEPGKLTPAASRSSASLAGQTFSRGVQALSSGRPASPKDTENQSSLLSLQSDAEAEVLFAPKLPTNTSFGGAARPEGGNGLVTAHGEAHGVSLATPVPVSERDRSPVRRRPNAAGVPAPPGAPASPTRHCVTSVLLNSRFNSRALEYCSPTETTARLERQIARECGVPELQPATDASSDGTFTLGDTRVEVAEFVKFLGDLAAEYKGKPRVSVPWHNRLAAPVGGFARKRRAVHVCWRPYEVVEKKAAHCPTGTTPQLNITTEENKIFHSQNYLNLTITDTAAVSAEPGASSGRGGALHGRPFKAPVHSILVPSSVGRAAVVPAAAGAAPAHPLHPTSTIRDDNSASSYNTSGRVSKQVSESMVGADTHGAATMGASGHADVEPPPHSSSTANDTDSDVPTVPTSYNGSGTEDYLNGGNVFRRPILAAHLKHSSQLAQRAYEDNALFVYMKMHCVKL